MTDEEIDRLTRMVEEIYGHDWKHYMKTLANALECIIVSSQYGQRLAESHI